MNYDVMLTFEWSEGLGFRNVVTRGYSVQGQMQYQKAPSAPSAYRRISIPIVHGHLASGQSLDYPIVHCNVMVSCAVFRRWSNCFYNHYIQALVKQIAEQKGSHSFLHNLTGEDKLYSEQIRMSHCAT